MGTVWPAKACLRSSPYSASGAFGAVAGLQLLSASHSESQHGRRRLFTRTYVTYELWALLGIKSLPSILTSRAEISEAN